MHVLWSLLATCGAKVLRVGCHASSSSALAEASSWCGQEPLASLQATRQRPFLRQSAF
jgi:hypothetical protein